MNELVRKKEELEKFRQQRIIELQRQVELQKKIGEMNTRLAAIVESSDDAIIGKDLDGTITSWNQGAEKIYGYRAEEVIGRHISLIVPSGRAGEASLILDRIRQGEKVDHFETVRLSKSGEEIPVSLTVSPIRDAAGSVIGASSIARDITGRRKDEETIHRQARILDQIQDAVITTDLDGNVMSWNRGAENLYSYTAEEAAGRHISFIYPESQRRFLEDEVIAPLKEKGEHECEALLRKKTGEEFQALLLLSMLKDADGSVIGMVGSSRDITARKVAEERIMNDRKEWEQTFDAMPDIVAVISREHIIRRANRALAARLGVNRDELIGNLCYEVICGLEKPRPDCPGTQSIRSGKEQIEERHLDKLNGHFLISCTPISFFDGEISCVVEVCRDISARKEMEMKLEEKAVTDVLTGLLNRRGFFALAGHQLHAADREQRDLILIYTDLDDLKKINDDFGHKEGDRALADAAHILSKSFRESDILGRIGGDEFAVLLTGPFEGEIERIISEHIRENLTAHNNTSGRPYPIELTMGFAHYDPAHPRTLHDLLEAADTRMYMRKRERQS